MKTMTRMALGSGLLAYRLLRRRSIWNFRGTSVLITGGSRGLGLVLARQLGAEGAHLTIVARDGAELERAASDLEARGATVQAFVCDVRDREQVEAAIERIIERYGRLDVLINSAGVIQAGPLENMQVQDFEDAIAVHMLGPLYTALAAVPHMRQQGGGRIVNISSIGGKIAVPHLLPYTTSKFGLVGLSDGLRAELAQYNIKVTTVCPGLMRTGSHYNALFKGNHERELIWFSLLDALPLTSVSAEYAARQIIDACRRGDAQLVISLQAKVLATLAPIAPGITATAMKLMNRLLPASPGPEGDQIQLGWDSRSAWVPSLLTRLADKATIWYNGLDGHTPPIDPYMIDQAQLMKGTAAMTEEHKGKAPQPDGTTPRPSQAEGDRDTPSGGPGHRGKAPQPDGTTPRPSQAEGDRETIEEDLDEQ